MARSVVGVGSLLAALLALGCGARRAAPLAAGAADGGGPTVGECAPGLVKCNDRCVDLSADQLHCGACNRPCGRWCNGRYEQQPCAAGTCVSPCPPAAISCCDGCVDPRTDDANCGSCGARCDTSAGFACQDGTCSCPAGFAECHGRCVDLAADPRNCGSCGVTCGSGCWNGRCTPATACSPHVWNGHTYAKCTSPVTWRDASLYCRSQGAHLVTLSSAAEDAFVFSITSQVDGVDYWTGFNDIRTEGLWEWDSGEGVVYVGFAQGEPNNADVAPDGEDCASWYPSGVGWNDNSCDLRWPFVCEWPWSSPSPGETFAWRSVGVGDCSAGDVAYSWGPDPLPSRCNAATVGQTAVCWDVLTYDNKEERAGQVWCTYKSTPTSGCWGGWNPGFMYACDGRPR